MPSSNSTHPIFYRSYQFFIALKSMFPLWAAEIAAEDKALLDTILKTDSQQAIFNRMSANDRRHALAVAHTLQQAGHNNLALMQAAILHDAAKSISQPIIHRVIIVLLEAFWTVALTRLSACLQQPVVDYIYKISWWRRPFVIHAHHPSIGAEWARMADCEPVAVELIARHQEDISGQGENNRLLTALQWADNLN